MRISRPCYDKPHRCPGWAGGGVRSAKVDRCKGDGGYVRTRPRWKPVDDDPEIFPEGGYEDDHPGSNQWRFGRCDGCGVRTWPYAVRWISPRYVLGWKISHWIRDWTLHRFEDGIWELGRFKDDREPAFGLWRWYLTKDYHEREWNVVGRVMMKESPEIDYYVEWSSITDSPVFAGNRDDALEHLRDNHRRRYSPDDRDSPENLLNLVDETGTSQRFRFPSAKCAVGAWDETGFVYNGRSWITRANVFAMAHRWEEQGEDANVDDLLEVDE